MGGAGGWVSQEIWLVLPMEETFLKGCANQLHRLFLSWREG